MLLIQKNHLILVDWVGLNNSYLKKEINIYIIFYIKNTSVNISIYHIIYPATGSPTATMLRLNPNYQQNSIKYYHI